MRSTTGSSYSRGSIISSNLHHQTATGFLAPGFGIFGSIRVASYGVQ
jgi:hypothetical protein